MKRLQAAELEHLVMKKTLAEVGAHTVARVCCRTCKCTSVVGYRFTLAQALWCDTHRKSDTEMKCTGC